MSNRGRHGWLLPTSFHCSSPNLKWTGLTFGIIFLLQCLPNCDLNLLEPHIWAVNLPSSWFDQPMKAERSKPRQPLQTSQPLLPTTVYPELPGITGWANEAQKKNRCMFTRACAFKLEEPQASLRTTGLFFRCFSNHCRGPMSLVSSEETDEVRNMDERKQPWLHLDKVGIVWGETRSPRVCASIRLWATLDYLIVCLSDQGLWGSY